jgi:uncharacterized membrane protein
MVCRTLQGAANFDPQEIIMPDQLSKSSFALRALAERHKTALKILALGVFLAASSFAIEYGSFAYRKTISDNGHYGDTVLLSQERISTDTFSWADQGFFLSQKENSVLTVKNDSGFINDLVIRLAKNPNLPIVLEYIDPKTGQKVTLEASAQTNLRKNGLVFLDFLVFHVASAPETIRIIAKNSGTGISQIIVDNNYRFNPYHFLFILAIGILSAFFILFRKHIGQKPEYAFLAIALVSGTLFSMGEPRSFVSWDEYIHYTRAHELAFKSIFPVDKVDIYDRTNLVPHSSSLEEQSAIDSYFDHHPEKKLGAENVPSGFSFVRAYNHLAYLPSGLALMLGRLLALPSHITFILGRWINIMLFSWLVFLAIRRLNSGKIILSVIALFPAIIFTASNYNYDSWLIGFTMLGSAYLFAALQEPEKKLTLREMSIMIGSLIVGCGPKAIYFPILLLLFLLKPKKFASTGQYKKFLLASVLSVLLILASFLLPIIISGIGNGDTRGGKDVDPSGQIVFILSDPLTYAAILFNSMKEYFNPANLAKVINYLAYLGNVSGYPLILATLLFATLSDKDGCDKEISNLKTKFLAIFIFFGTVALIATSMYIEFTPIHNRMIVGVQPRYLFPLLFPLFFLIGDYRASFPINKNICYTVIFAIMTFVLMQGIWDLIIKFYY